MKEIQINDLEYADLEKLYSLIKCNEASVTCNGSKVLAFDDPEWSNIVRRESIEELEDFILQNQDAPDESPVITSKTVVESQGVGENWTSEYRIEKLSYFRELLKKYKALIEEHFTQYMEKAYIDTSKSYHRKWNEFLRNPFRSMNEKQYKEFIEIASDISNWLPIIPEEGVRSKQNKGE